MAAVSPGVASAQEQGWELEALNVPVAHDNATGEGVTVAVIDTGIGQHPDLDESKILDGIDLSSPEGDELNDPRRDSDGHGTAMAGKITEVAPDAQLLPVRVTTTDESQLTGEGHLQAEAEGIIWAVDNGADVINISATGREAEETRDAVQYALDNSVVVVAGTGNEPDEQVRWPAAFPGVVAVTGTDEDNTLWLREDGVGSTTGPEVSVAAPAAVMDTLIPQDFFSEEDDLYNDNDGGTSAATALTSGVVALIRSAYPDLDAANVINRLISTTTDLGDSGRDDTFGHGLVNAETALTAEVDSVDANPLGDPGGSPIDNGDDTATDNAPSADQTQLTADENNSNTTTVIVIIAVAAVLVAVIAALLIARARKRPRQSQY